METRSDILLLIVIAALSFVAEINAFSCYTCGEGDACEDVTEKMKTDCVSPLGAVNTCIKAKVNGNFIRSCGVPGTNVNECQKDTGVVVCMCTTDLCNTATSKKVSFFTWSAGLIIPVVVRLLYR